MVRNIVISGATDGIGKVMARRLAAPHTVVWVLGRNAAKVASVVAELGQAQPEGRFRGLTADLSLQAATVELGRQLCQELSHVDVLINNAGAFFAEFQRTSEGLERTFALNHLSYFLLSQMLLPRLKEAPHGRIINVASHAHRGYSIDFADLQCEKGYRAWTAYGRSKLANILFTRELARRLKGTTVTANCFHPGFVASKFGHNNARLTRFVIMAAQKIAAIDVERGAETGIFLANDQSLGATSGEYFYKRKLVQPSKAARDEQAASKLWQASEAMALKH